MAQNTPEGRKYATLSAGWYWDTHYAGATANGKLNDKALTIKWEGKEVNSNQEVEFNKISQGVGGTNHEARWKNYEKNVKAVLNGGNPYENIRTGLSKLGLSASGEKDYEKTFGIVLSKRDPEPIDKGSQNLSADHGDMSFESSHVPEWSTTQEANLRVQANQWFDQIRKTNKDEMMNSHAQQLAAGLLSGALLTVASNDVDAAQKYAVGVCQVQSQDLQAELDPSLDVKSYVYKYQRDNPEFKSLNTGEFANEAKIILLNRPKFGVLKRGEEEWNKDTWYYRPTKSNKDGRYVGRDHFVMKAEHKGITVYIHYYIEVVGNDPTTYAEGDQRLPHFCKVESWKISLANPESQSDFTQWQTSASLNAMLANASGSLTNFSDLAGTAVGQTTGQGPTAQITLDSTAAGHGWFIDATPENNEEFLPTSDPEVWIAKAGSAAAGKMDMLSVLLHEYGHALGIEHSSDSADYMAASLQPGERRLPSRDELSLMSRLVAALKGDNPNVPSDPWAPLASIGLLALGRIRRSDYGWTLNLDQAQLNPRYEIAKLTQKETVVNTTLSQHSNDWQTAGTVTLQSNIASSTITLAEDSATQAHAHATQSFAVKQGDRYLSFTVANNGLQANSIDQDGNELGPDDAFEVALLNANTGLSVAGNTGLSRSDALLNIQSDGTAHQATSVRKVHNLDGSDTYYVDLQQAVNQSNGLVTGTPVSLLCDLVNIPTLSAPSTPYAQSPDSPQNP